MPLAGATRLEMPCIRLLSSESQDTTVRFVAGNELSLTEASVHNLSAVDFKGAGRVYRTNGRMDYGGTWRIHTGPAKVRIVTITQMRDRKLMFTAILECQPAHGNVQSLAVRVRNWAGSVRIDAPPALRQREQRRGPDDRVWLLDQGPGAAGPLRITLSGEQQTEAPSDAVTPDVTVLGTAHVERWAVVTGSNLTAEPSGGLTPVQNATVYRSPLLRSMLSTTKAWDATTGADL